MSTTKTSDGNAVGVVTARTASQPADWKVATALLGQYFEWLAPIAGVSSVLEAQAGAKDELGNMAAAYGRPRTVLKLASWGDRDVGMIGLKPHGLPVATSSRTAEIVRFFTLPSARNAGAGSVLLSSAIEAAGRFGYSSVVLDTLPEAMTQAVRLYGRYGFVGTDEPHDLPVEAGQRFRLHL